MRVLIVGGVAGGMSTATRLRRLDEQAEIVVLEAGEHVSFANCGLPYYVGGVIEDRAELLPRSAASFAERFRIDVRPRHEAVALDLAAKRLAVRTADGATAEEPYDVLVLAGGATAATPLHGGVPVRTLRTVDDADAISAVLDAAAPGSPVVVVGAGYIGLEAVENLVRRGCAVTLVQRGEQPLSPLDPEMASPIVDELRRHDVDVRLGRSVERIGAGSVVLDDGAEVPAVLVVEAVGIAPDTALARAAGLTIGAAGGIAVDGFQRTSDPAVYAVGDAAEKVDRIDGGATLIALAGLANRHGRTAADAIAGVAEPSVPALGTSIVGVFDLAVAMVGWSERRLRAAGRPHRVVHVHPASRAGYYPGGSTLAIKLLVDAATDAILGAQVVGREGVDTRIDVIAVAMAGGLTATALSRLELAYAPQFGSAKDAVNIAGYAAGNVAAGTIRSIQWHELDAARAAGATLLDVRSAGEYQRGHIPGAVNLPVDELRDRAGEVPDGPVIVQCQVGQRGHVAARLLGQTGHDVRNLDGGYVTWLAGEAAGVTV